MTDEEAQLSRSTPGYRFDVTATPAPAPQEDETPAPADPGARESVNALIGDRAQPVVMFALEWCEFCWSVRKFFARLGIRYRSVDLDSVAYQRDDLGGRIRDVLADRVGVRTIPQVFIGGEHIGGCTDLFDAWRHGSLPQRLLGLGIEFDRDVEVDPYDLLPKWVQPRKSA
jgi:cysteine synthase A